MTSSFTPPAPLQTAVLFLVFNRPDTTARVFEGIRQAKPPRLYVAADGPREGREGEAERVAKVREIATAVDWPCEVHTLFREKNLGCKYAVSSAITWFFEQEEQGIILEDDCLASQSFFWFCEKMLNRFSENDAVMSVTGTNITRGLFFEADYFFSKYALMWGWASWARAWKKYDLDLEHWPRHRQSGHLKELGITGSAEIRVWKKILNRTKRREIDTWDYQWIYSCWRDGGLTVAPKKNLIRNLGFSTDATHTTGYHPTLSNLQLNDLDWPLEEPVNCAPNAEADDFIRKYWFGVNWKSFNKSLILRFPGVAKINEFRKQYIEKTIRKAAHTFGIEITRYRPSNSAAAQLAKALEVAGINVVFDIGANEGQFAREIREYGYTGKIVSFEPLSSARKKLLALASVDSNWQVGDQSAIGGQDGEIEIYIAGNSVSSSVLPMLDSHRSAAIGSAYIDSERVPIAKLDSVAKQYITPESKLFIKIDTQGFEWQVLDGADETLQQACGVLCELSLVPLYDGQRLWRDIVDRLDAEGFMLWALLKGFTDPRTGQSLQMDGIFLRRDVLKK